MRDNMAGRRVSIPHGFLFNGSKINARAHDEEYLSYGKCKPILSRINGLLNRMILMENLNILEMAEIIENLTLGDKVVLLSHIRGLTYGYVFEFSIQCHDCKENISFDVSWHDFEQHSLQGLEEINFEMSCPSCNSTFTNSINFVEHLIQSLSLGQEQLFHEIHILAKEYNWSLDAILSLSISKRKTFAKLALTG